MMTSKKLVGITAVLIFVAGIVVYFKISSSTQLKPASSKDKAEQQVKDEIALGKKLFSDKRLSRNETISCLTCHIPQKAFTDGLPKSIGINDLVALRNAPSLYNIADAPYFMHDGGVPTLEMQAIVPIQDLNEMGFSMKELISRLKTIPEYVSTFERVFQREIDAWTITRSLAQFEKTLISKQSRFDLFLLDSIKHPLSQNELNGWKLFSSDFGCVKCHALPNFTNYQFESNFLTQQSNDDPGRFRITGKEEDRGKFKIPSLRNVTLTAPYMHDGSYKTLEEVVEAYFNAQKSTIRPKSQLTKKEISDLMAFFGTLIDTSSVDLTRF